LQSQVSVLLPVYNGEAALREAIESVLEQDYEPFELVIVDNASTDGTANIIDGYKNDERVRVVKNDYTLPRLDNFVKAFGLASRESRWLKFIGDDDRLLPGCLREMVEAGEAAGGPEQVGLVSSHYYDGDHLVTGILPPETESVSGPQFLRRLLLEPEARSTVFSPASLLVSHLAYRQLGPFRTDLLHADSELFYRILNRYDLAFVHKPLTVTGFHGESGQAGSTALGHTFSEAYLIRYDHLKQYDNVRVSAMEVEKIKLNLVKDSVGFMLARMAGGQWGLALGHLKKIPLKAWYHLPLGFGYFAGLALKKLTRREKIRLLEK